MMMRFLKRVKQYNLYKMYLKIVSKLGRQVKQKGKLLNLLKLTLGKYSKSADV